MADELEQPHGGDSEPQVEIEDEFEDDGEDTDVDKFEDDDEDQDPDEEPGDDDEDDEDDGEPEEDAFEIEVDGVKHKVPAALRDQFLMQQDYTRKTQAVAEEKRALAEQQTALQQQVQFQQEHMQEVAEVAAINRQLAEYDAIDWNRFYAENPNGAAQASHEHQMLLAQKNQVQQKLETSFRDTQQRQQAELAAAKQQCADVVAKTIPDWSPELDVELGKYARKIGYSDQVLQSITNPSDIITLHKAYLYDQLQEKRAQKPKAKPKAVKPVGKVSGKSQGRSKDPDKMSMDEWAEWRNKQIAKRS